MEGTRSGGMKGQGQQADGVEVTTMMYDYHQSFYLGADNKHPSRTAGNKLDRARAGEETGKFYFNRLKNIQ